MESYLIKGILIGLIFGMPVGAVGTMTVQRTFRYGFQAGLMTGLGSSVADCLYACVGVFGLTFISDFLFKYQVLINISGGTFVLIMGIRLILGSSKTNTLQAGTVYGIKNYPKAVKTSWRNRRQWRKIFCFSVKGRAEVYGEYSGYVGPYCSQKYCEKR